MCLQIKRYDRQAKGKKCLILGANLERVIYRKTSRHGIVPPLERRSLKILVGGEKLRENLCTVEVYHRVSVRAEFCSHGEPKFSSGNARLYKNTNFCITNMFG